MKALLLTLPLAACAAPGDPPSLLPRAIERTANLPAVETAAVFAPADPALAGELTALLRQARAGDAAFARALQSARGQSFGAPRESEAWIVAQTALSGAEAARAPTLDALATIDARVGTEVTSGRDPARALAARDQIQAIADSQTRRLRALTR